MPSNAFHRRRRRRRWFFLLSIVSKPFFIPNPAAPLTPSRTAFLANFGADFLAVSKAACFKAGAEARAVLNKNGRSLANPQKIPSPLMTRLRRLNVLFRAMLLEKWGLSVLDPLFLYFPRSVSSSIVTFGTCHSHASVFFASAQIHSKCGSCQQSSYTSSSLTFSRLFEMLVSLLSFLSFCWHFVSSFSFLLNWMGL